MTDAADHELSSQPRTIKRGGGRRWIHPTATRGRYTRLRLVSSLLLLLVLYATPWLKIHGQPVIRLSFLDSSFVLFGSPILIYEFYHFVLMALLLVFTLFLVSALYGRIWCGYACPQTVFVEQIFGLIETLFEGPAARRILAEAKPLTVDRVFRKIGKQAAFLTVSGSFAFTLVAIFTGPETIIQDHSRSANMAILLLTALAWFDGAYWREQFCHIVCPYGRFQGVMQDAATRTIGYDPHRGEPRKRGKDRAGAGDCIDCGLCVRVCPSGIDIRQGAHQIECIACAKCIDACDGIMRSVGTPAGLIRYDAASMFAADRPPGAPSMFRPRLLVYAAIWLALFGVGTYQFLNRTTFHTRVLSTSGTAPYFLDGAKVKNLFSLKVGNQWRDADTYLLSASLAPEEGSPGGDGGATAPTIDSPTRLGPLKPGQEGSFPVLVSSTRSQVGKRLILTVTAVGSGEVKLVDRQIVGPSPAP